MVVIEDMIIVALFEDESTKEEGKGTAGAGGCRND